MSLRKNRWILVSVLWLAALLLTAGLANSQTIKLRYANFPPASTFPCVQMERWAKEVEKRTAGKVKVDTFPGGTLAGPKNMMEAVAAGYAEIGNLPISVKPGLFPVSETLDLPIGLPNAKVASLAFYDLIEKYNPKEFRSFKVITLFTCPPANIMTKTPVKTFKDMKRMEIRVQSTVVDLVKSLGAIPVAMPGSEVAEALQKGVVKGHITSFDTLKDFMFAAYTPYALTTNMYVVSMAVLMNKAKWESLPDDAKKVIDDLRREQALWTGKYVDDHAAEAVAWSKEKYDFKVFELSQSDKAELARQSKRMVDDHVNKLNGLGLSGAQIVQDLYSLKEKLEKQYKN